MSQSFDAISTITVAATRETVWAALTTPATIKQYLFGTEVVSNWKVGSPIMYRGVWKGTPYEDKGVILTSEPRVRFAASYYSALSGLPDTPENYNIVTYDLAVEAPGFTRLTVTQTNNPTAEAAELAKGNWSATLTAIKDLLQK